MMQTDMAVRKVTDDTAAALNMFECRREDSELVVTVVL